MSSLSDIAAGLGPVAQGYAGGQLQGLEQQRSLQETAFNQAQARESLNLKKGELQQQQKTLDAQEREQIRAIADRHLGEVNTELHDPRLQYYFNTPAGQKYQKQLTDYRDGLTHAVASGKPEDLMADHPQANARIATDLGIPLPGPLQASPLKLNAGTPAGGPTAPAAAPPTPEAASQPSPAQPFDMAALARHVQNVMQGVNQSPSIATPAAPAAPTAAAPVAGAPPTAPVAPVAAPPVSQPAPGATPGTQPGGFSAMLAPFFEDRPGELPEQSDARRMQGIQALAELENAGISRARLAQELGIKQADLELEYKKLAQERGLKLVELGQGKELKLRELAQAGQIAQGQQATALLGHVLTYDAAAAGRDAKYNQDYVTNSQHAITVGIQDARAKAMALRGQLSALVREDMASQAKVTNGVYQSATGQGKVGLDLGGVASIGAALSETGGSREQVTQTKFYNTPEHLKVVEVMNQLRGLENTTPPYVPRNIGEARLLSEPINDADRQAMAAKIGTQGNNLLAFSKTWQELRSANPAAAIRMVKTYQAMYPNRPLPKGVSLSTVSNPEGQAAVKAAAAPAPTAAAGMPGGDRTTLPPVPGIMGNILRGIQGAAQQGAQTPFPGY